MNLISYIIDRLPFVAVYFINVIILLIIVQLDMLQSNQSLEWGNVAYFFILSSCILLSFLIIGYLRRRPFYREINDLRQNVSSIEDVLNVESSLTTEQAVFQDLLHEGYRQYVKELADYEEQRERHHHFTNQWVHHMKTPVSVIHLLIQQGRQAPSIEEAGKLIQSIGEENERLEHGLEMILHMARLEKFEFDVTPKRVELLSLIREAINEHKKAMIRQAIYPKVVAEPEEVFIESDEKWLRFVIRQITANAVKYSYKGKDDTIEFIVKRQSTSWTLSICDSGIGIPQQDIKRVFSPFFTGENGRKTRESTGMGLYLVKEVCDRLGHRIDAESQEGEGTVITLEFLDSATLHHSVTGKGEWL